MPFAKVFQRTAVNPFLRSVPVFPGSVTVIVSTSVIDVGDVPLVALFESKDMTGRFAFHWITTRPSPALEHATVPQSWYPPRPAFNLY